MALDTTLRGWLEEVKHGKSNGAQCLKGYREDIKNFVGTGFREGFGRNQPENHALEWFSIMRSICLMGNPKVRYTTDTPGMPQLRARAYSYAMSNWTIQTRMRNLNEKLLMDWGFRRAVCLVTSGQAPGYTEQEDAPYWPAAHRIATHHFIHDPASMSPETWEWTAHLVIGSRKELLQKAADPDTGWNAEALNRLQHLNVKKFRDEKMSMPERDEVPYWEIHARWIELDESDGAAEGYHGTTFTVVDEQPADVDWVRKPMPYFGPRAGPHVVSGDFVVPDEAFPLSHVVATKAQAEHLNRIARATIKAIEAYKRLILARNSDNLSEKIQAGKNDFVYSYNDNDLKSAIYPVELGGATDQHFAAKEDARGTLDRVSGMTDEMRGETQQDVKATQAALAAQSAQVKGNFPVAKFRDFIGEIIRRAGYFAARDHDVALDFGEMVDGDLIDPETGMPITGIQGGLAEDEDPDEYDRMGFEIQVGSMERDLAADTAIRLQAIDQTFQEMAAIGPQASLFMDMQTYLDLKAELTGVDELKRIVDVPRMQQLGMMMLMGAPGGGAGASAPQAAATPNPTLVAAPKQRSSLPQTMARKAGQGPQSEAKAGKKLQGASR